MFTKGGAIGHGWVDSSCTSLTALSGGVSGIVSGRTNLAPRHKEKRVVDLLGRILPEHRAPGLVFDLRWERDGKC